MHFKNLAIAAVLANLCVLVPSLSPAQAATLFNSNTNSSTGGSTAAAPVFIPVPAKAAPAAPVSNNLYTNSGQTLQMKNTQPKKTPMTQEEYDTMAAAVKSQNAAVSAVRGASVQANAAAAQEKYAQTLAGEKAARAKAAAAAASGGGSAAAAAQAAQPADPYAGRAVIFSGAKKADGDKPNRLFNVQ